MHGDPVLQPCQRVVWRLSHPRPDPHLFRHRQSELNKDWRQCRLVSVLVDPAVVPLLCGLRHLRPYRRSMTAQGTGMRRMMKLDVDEK